MDLSSSHTRPSAALKQMALKQNALTQQKFWWIYEDITNENTALDIEDDDESGDTESETPLNPYSDENSALDILCFLYILPSNMEDDPFNLLESLKQLF